MACRSDRISSNRLPKTRPASSRIVFCIRTEQRIAASRAKVTSLLMRVPVSVGERQFRSPSSKYVILANRQDVFPLIVRELHFLNDKVSGSLRIVPGEMDTLRREINGFEGFDRLGGRQPFLTALDCSLQCNIEWTLDPSD